MTLVTTSSIPSSPSIQRMQVETAIEMNDAVISVNPDIAVMAAAVADFAPIAPSDHKLARKDGPPVVDLGPSPDILAGVARRAVRPLLVGFAAETGSLDRAIEKAASKGVDLLVANDVSEPGSGFGTDTNRVSIVRPDGTVDEWQLMPKAEVAARLWDLIEEMRTQP